MYDSSVGYNIIDAGDIIDIQEYMIKKHNIVYMPGFIKQTFVVLVLVLLICSESLAIKCVSMNNQPSMLRPTLTDENPDEFIPIHLSLV